MEIMFRVDNGDSEQNGWNPVVVQGRKGCRPADLGELNIPRKTKPYLSEEGDVFCHGMEGWVDYYTSPKVRNSGHKIPRPIGWVVALRNPETGERVIIPRVYDTLDGAMDGVAELAKGAYK